MWETNFNCQRDLKIFKSRRYLYSSQKLCLWTNFWLSQKYGLIFWQRVIFAQNKKVFYPFKKLFSGLAIFGSLLGSAFGQDVLKCKETVADHLRRYDDLMSQYQALIEKTGAQTAKINTYENLLVTGLQTEIILLKKSQRYNKKHL